MNVFKVSLLSSLVLMLGCTSDQIISPGEDLSTDQTLVEPTDEGVLKGVIRVKLSESMVEGLKLSDTGGKLTCNNAELEKYLHNLGAVKMKRVFPDAGKFENRSRESGLHLWYDIEFDKSHPITRASSDAKKIPGIDIVEKIYQPELLPYKVVASDKDGETNTSFPFNDPELSKQWHYQNFGTFSQSVQGADINLFNAWKIETGKPNVIVAVVDGGVDFNHEDLKDNMHVNLAELNGKPGVDDDGNGYDDDIYGYNFFDDSPQIMPHMHGTHVAGTVAARNNNNKGVCGVAGGDGTKDSGVRIMSCQIFPHDSRLGSGDAASAIKYAADNGAVICQNSWGYPYPGMEEIPVSIREAIDYFIKYAGCDKDGNQRPDSPMKGGVVIFAAGNDGQDFLAYPAAYPRVISVSAMAPDFKAAWYTNRGSWVSIMAPGGDQFYKDGMVYSTTPGNTYGYEQGTSMACPHVSGIAALVVSHYGKQGFTNEDLKRRLLTALRPYDIDTYNPKYKGKLGIGYIDAYEALRENKNKCPDAVKTLKAVPDYIKIDLSWKAVADEDDRVPFTYQLYYSDNTDLNEKNYNQGNLVEIPAKNYNVGDEVKYELKDLKLNTNYHFALFAVDRWGLMSKPYTFTAKTKENLPPVLTLSGDKNIKLTGTETAQVKIAIKEPENQKWTYKISGMSIGVDAVREKDAIIISYKATAPYGKYKTEVVVEDIYHTAATVEIPFEIYENHPPKLVKEFANLYLPLGKKLELNLNDYFIDEDGHSIIYNIRASNSSIVSVEQKENKLTLNPQHRGRMALSVTASDTQKAYVNSNISVLVVEDQLVYVAYPIPAKTLLNVVLSSEVKEGTIKILTNSGKVVYSRQVSVRNQDDQLQKINVSKLAGGTYFLKVEANGKQFKQSFIKL